MLSSRGLPSQHIMESLVCEDEVFFAQFKTRQAVIAQRVFYLYENKTIAFIS